MSIFLRILVGFISIASVIPILFGMLFLGGMGSSFGTGFHTSDYLLFSGMTLSIFYFLASFVTCIRKFSHVAIARIGLLLHFIVMPLSVLLIYLVIGFNAAVYLILGIAFSGLWFVMVKTVSRDTEN